MRAVVLLCLAFALAACGGPRHVTYEVAGYSLISLTAFDERPGQAHPVALTYRNASGGTEQVTARTPWVLDLTTNGPLYVSAQKQETISKIVCRILVDGKEIQRAESTASYGIATCAAP